MELQIKGHSGYKIEVIREGCDLFVYKSSEERNQSLRLLKQAQKQQEAYTRIQRDLSGLRVPNILAVTQKNEETLMIKMDYIYSLNFIEFFENAGYERLDHFVQSMIRFVDYEISLSPIQPVDIRAVKSKMKNVTDTISNNKALIKDDVLQNILHTALQKIESCAEIKLPVGTCHGDLTFSNILFNTHSYYLIDFLDSFIESPIMDICKLRQDSAHLWSQLMYTHSYDKIRLRIILEKVDEAFHSHFMRYGWYNDFYVLFQMLNLLRVLQYAHEEKIISHLKNELTRLLYVV